MAQQAHFGFTKLVVKDLDRAAEFYSKVCGLTEMARVDSEITSRGISEVMFTPAAEGAAMFVLLKFHDVEAPSSNEVIVGFQTDDLEGFIDRAQQAGGKLVDPIRIMPEHGIKVAFITDIEGHLLEVVELLAGGHA